MRIIVSLCVCWTLLGPAACVPPGSRGCSKDTDCLSGRICEQGECRSPEQSENGGSSSADSDGSQSGSTQAESDASSSSDPATSASSDPSATSGDETSSGSTDDCAANDGELLPGGFCFKNCTQDFESPGNDLFADCVPLGMVCVSDAFDFPDYCLPSGWGGVNQCADSCSPGGTCVEEEFPTGSALRNSCHIACSDDSDCGTLRCITSCPGGRYKTTGLCHDGYGWPLADTYISGCAP